MANQKNEDDPKMEAIAKPCTPSESLEQSLKELNMIKQGSLKKRSWEDFRNELKKTEQ